MKKFLIALILIANLNLPKANASGDALGAAAAALAVTGVIYTFDSFQYDEWLKSEMQSWKYDETDLTTSLSRSCDVNLELKLHRSRRISYVVFVIHNDHDKPISVTANDIYATYSNGAIRRFKSTHAASDVKVDAGWTVQGFYPISEKTELADIDYIDMSIPMIGTDGKTPCEIKGRLNRNKNRTPDYMDYNRLLQGEFGFFYGNNLVSSNSLKNSSDKRGLFGLIFNGFFYKNYGLALGILFQDLKQNNNAAVKTYARSTGDFEIGERDYYVGIAANYLYGRKYSITLSGGVLDQTIVNPRDQESDIVSQVGGYLNANFNYIFYSSDYLPVRGDYMVGLGLLGKFVPKYSLGSAEFGGSSLAPYINFNIGF